MEEYKSNSHKSREKQKEAIPEKKVEKIITGSARSQKKSSIQKITNVFIPEDVENVKSYIFEDIVVPAVKDIILDAVRAFLGVNNRSGSKGSSAAKVSYRKYYEENNRRDYSESRVRTMYDYDNVVVESRGEAENVLAMMDELISEYKIVSVADLYDLVGIDGSYTDNRYGWTNIRTASVVRVRDGYMIKLPKPQPLD